MKFDVIKRCKLTEFGTDVPNSDARQRLVGVHVSYLHNKSMRPIVLKSAIAQISASAAELRRSMRLELNEYSYGSRHP